MNFPKEGECGCRKCSREWDEKNLPDNLDLITRYMQSRSYRYIVCDICGNKRCPHATDHELECTGSNDPGQPGSVYQ